MKRLLPLLLLVCAGCVTDVIHTIPSLTLRVSPHDTLMARPRASIVYGIRTLSEDDSLPWATVHRRSAFSGDTVIAEQTDQHGQLLSTFKIPDVTGAGLYEVSFKALKQNHGSSSTERRFIRVIDSGSTEGVSVDVVARGVRPDGSISAEPLSPSASMHSRSSMPLLPHIFFDANSATIPERYHRMGSTGFTIMSLAGKTAVDAHYHVLDNIGLRLRLYPSADIFIVGTNSNAGAEKGNISLSRQRAESVRQYLVNTWGIDNGRVVVDSRNLPEIPSNPVLIEGMEENRRVEFASNDSRITAPISIEQRETLTLDETLVRFEITHEPAGHPFKNWIITLYHNDSLIGQALSGSGAPPAVQTMTIAKVTDLIDQPLRYQLEVTDVWGNLFSDQGMTRIVPVTVVRSNLEQFAMLTFDFDRSDINERARQMLELVSESISRDARALRIDGFTDHTGSDEYNQPLSEARANAAATSLRSMTTLPAATNLTGHGERDPKFDNNLPEGRQLNRRVEFTIEKSKI